MKQIAIKVVGPLVAALVGVLGGAYVAYQQLEPRARIEERTEQAAETYADYLDAIARTTPLETPLQNVVAAKARVAVYGNVETVAAVAAIEGNMSDPIDRERLVQAIAAFRAELDAEAASPSDLHRLLFGD